MKKNWILVCIVLIFFSCSGFGAPVPEAFRLEESLARELSSAALRGTSYLVSLQKDNGSFSDDSVLDRQIADLIRTFAQDEPEIKKALQKHRPPEGSAQSAGGTEPDLKSQAYRELFYLVRALRKAEGSVLFPERFRSWRNETAKRLLETQNGEGAWENAQGTFYALCAIYLIF